jgi:DNA helicase-2/ATP-dependent DNA helicase PcrA
MSKHTPTLHQQKAIDLIDGPVRVLAGPGTGKTEILSLRIANMLQSEAQIDASNILCITYTDAARVNMRQRLSSKVGVPTAQRIAIHTYHSFCDTVIQQHSSYFNKSELQLVTELENLKIVQDILDKLPKTSLLFNAKQPYRYVGDLLRMYDTIKQENLHVDQIHKAIDQHIQEDIVDNEEHYYKRASGDKKAGDKKDTYDKAIERAALLREAVDTFPMYVQALLDAGRYDFSDMIHWIINLFEQQPHILSDYAEKYMYIMVDEYQDTNGTQNRLIQLLADAAGLNAPNLFVVGDDDQSIFRFQGASSANMRMVEHKYSDSLQDVQLVDNFRSTQAILDFAESFIKVNTTRIKTNFTGLTSYSKADNLVPQCYGLLNERQEFIYLAERIKALVQQGVPTNEIAVLMTKNDKLSRMSQYLKHLGIPTYTKKHGDMLEMTVVKYIFSILHYLYQEGTTSYSGVNTLFRILHLPFFKIPANDIAIASYMCSRSSVRDFRRFLNAVADGTLSEEIAAQNAGRNEQLNVSEEILAANAILEQLIADAANLNAYQVFKEVVHRCKVHRYILTHESKIELLDELTTMFDFVEAETAARPDLTTARLVEELLVLKDNGMPISRSRAFGKDNGVQLLTIHGSKGLEFEHVFVAGNIAANWDTKRAMNATFGLPENLTKDIELQKQGGDSNDDFHHENRRLLYVAFTRAKKTLTCTYHRKGKNDKELEPSCYLLEAFKDLSNTQPEPAFEVTTELLAFYEPVDRTEEKTAVELQEIETALVQAHCKGLVLSATSLNKYLNCQIAYYYDKVLSVPSGINESMSFGSALHDAIEKYFIDSKQQNAWQSKQHLLDIFDRLMWQRRRNFTPKSAEALSTYGQEVLATNYDRFINEWQLNSEIEWRPQATVEVDGIPIVGFLDRLDFDGNACNIVDYKSGNPDKAEKVKKNFVAGGQAVRGKDTLTKGGDYWRQGVFYKLIIDNCKEVNWDVTSAEFIYLEPSKRTGEIYSQKVYIRDEDLAFVTQQLREAYDGIQAHEFSQGCGEQFCDWCNFVKENAPQPIR